MREETNANFFSTEFHANYLAGNWANRNVMNALMCLTLPSFYERDQVERCSLI